MRIALLGVLVAAVVLASGAAVAIAADPVGPVCLTLDKFTDKLEMFLLPNGGSQFLLTVRTTALSSPNTYAGSAAIYGNEFLFGFTSTHVDAASLIAFRGTLNLGTLTGPGNCSIVATPPLDLGCGTGTAVVFTATPGPCS